MYLDRGPGEERRREVSRSTRDRDASEVAADGRARILEPGYRPYRGVRLGVSPLRVGPGPAHGRTDHGPEAARPLQGACRSLPCSSPTCPAIAFIGIVALLPNGRIRLSNLIPGPGRYYAFITAAIILFAALAAPEALCPDKRSRFLGVYLSSPLNRSTYLLAKAIAVIGVLLLVTRRAAAAAADRPGAAKRRAAELRRLHGHARRRSWSPECRCP